MTVNVTATELKVAQKTGSALLCAFAGTTGTYTGTATLEGLEYKGNSGTTTTPGYGGGKAVNIEITS